MTDDKNTETHTEEVEPKDLVQRVRDYAADAKTKHIRITEPDGDLVLEIPLTVGAVAGGAIVLAAPLLAALGAVAALVTRVKIEVARETEDA